MSRPPLSTATGSDKPKSAGVKEQPSLTEISHHIGNGRTINKRRILVIHYHLLLTDRSVARMVNKQPLDISSANRIEIVRRLHFARYNAIHIINSLRHPDMQLRAAKTVSAVVRLATTSLKEEQLKSGAKLSDTTTRWLQVAAFPAASTNCQTRFVVPTL